MPISARHNFISAMRWLLVLLFAAPVFMARGQEKQVEGIVFERDTKDRLAHIAILNINTGKSYYNNLKGEFKVGAQPGDKLVFSKDDYLPDTVLIKTPGNIVVYLQRNAIMLHVVTVRDSLNTPLQRLLATKKEYNKAYGSNAASDLFSTIPGGGAGISLDAIYNSISKSGRDAEHLRGLIQGDYEQNVIDYRFNKSYVAGITKLKGQELFDFMNHYRPSFNRVSTNSEYEFVSYIRTSLKRYLRNKRVFAQPPLKPQS